MPFAKLKPTKAQKPIIAGMAATLSAMRDAELVYEIQLCKIADEEHALYAQALASEVSERLKAAKAKARAAKKGK